MIYIYIYIALCAHCLALPLTGMGCAHAIALSVNMCTLNCVHIEPVIYKYIITIAGASETFKLLGCQKLAQIAWVSETCSNCWGVRNFFFKLLGFQKLAQIAGVSETCLILGCQKPVQIVGVSETC